MEKGQSFTVSAAVRRHESQGDQFPVDFKSSSAQGCHHGSWYHCNIVSEGQTNANAECSQIHVYQSHSNCLSVCPLQAFLAGSTRAKKPVSSHRVYREFTGTYSRVQVLQYCNKHDILHINRKH